MSAAAQSAERIRVVRLMTLWGQYWSAAGPSTAEDSRVARLHYIAAVIGHPVESANDLLPNEVVQVARRLQNDIAAQTREEERGLATREQLYTIRTLEQRLGWAARPERLAGFLWNTYRVRRPDRLSHGGARKAIESLYAVLARSEIKGAKGSGYPVGKPELARAVANLKGQHA